MKSALPLIALVFFLGFFFRFCLSFLYFSSPHFISSPRVIKYRTAYAKHNAWKSIVFVLVVQLSGIFQHKRNWSHSLICCTNKRRNEWMNEWMKKQNEKKVATETQTKKDNLSRAWNETQCAICKQNNVKLTTDIKWCTCELYRLV